MQKEVKARADGNKFADYGILKDCTDVAYTRVLHETKVMYPGYVKLVDEVKKLVKSHDFFNDAEWVDCTGKKELETRVARGLFLRRFENFLCGMATENSCANYLVMDKRFKAVLKNKKVQWMKYFKQDRIKV